MSADTHTSTTPQSPLVAGQDMAHDQHVIKQTSVASLCSATTAQLLQHSIRNSKKQM
jgi:hypothetical protein